MAKELTATQVRVLTYIIEQTELYAAAPSMREISIMFGFRSTRGAIVHLDALERKGHIARTSSSSRGIRVLKDPTGQPVTLRYVSAPTPLAIDPQPVLS